MTVERDRLMKWKPLPRVKVYKDTMNLVTYICDWPHWALLTDPVWNIKKQYDLWAVYDEVQETWYWYKATDLSTVQWHTYS